VHNFFYNFIVRTKGLLAKRGDLNSVSGTIIETTKIGFVRAFLAIPIYLLLTPFVINQIGKEMYGLWALSSIIHTFILLSDFGFKNGLVHFTAKNLKHPERIREYFNATFYFFLAGSLLCVVVIILYKDFIVAELLKIAPRYHSEGVFLLISVSVGFSLRLISTSYQAVIEGNQRVYYSQKVLLHWMLLNATAIFICLYFYPTIYSLCLINVFGNIFIFAMFLFDAKKNYLYVDGIPRQFHMTSLIKIFPYSVWIQIATIFIICREPLLKIIIARDYGLESLAAFEISYRLTVQAMSFAMIPVLTALPIASRYHNQVDKISGLAKKYVTWVFLILVIPNIAVIWFTPRLIELWLGEGFSNVVEILPIIFFGFSIYYLSEPFYKIIQGMGYPKASALVQVTFLLCLILVNYASGSALGFKSVGYSILAAGTIFSLTNVLIIRRAVRTKKANIQ
jgi:O-antigen/teichoic acid export membrane protein